jgi:hypothetical protein
MLIPLLFSIERSHPEALISVYWEDIPESTKSLIQKAYPKAEYIDTHFDFTTDIAKRISSKTLVWELAAKDKQDEAGWLFFMDTDMLVLKDIRPLLETISGDILYTYRQGQFWINSGILACRKHPEMAHFFTQWREKTQAILNDPILFAQANDKKLHYGGADQMSLQQLLNYSIEKNNYTLPTTTLPLQFTGVNCEYLNETYSRPVTEKTHVIHYKGGWRDILFFGGNFTPNRSKEDSWEMYMLYLRTFQEAVDSLNKKLGTQYSCQDFGLAIPWYLNQYFQEIPYRYPIYVLWKKVSTFFPRLLKYLKERILS